MYRPLFVLVVLLSFLWCPGHVIIHAHWCPLRGIAIGASLTHSFTHSLPCSPSLILFLRSFLLSYLCYPYLAILKSQAELRFATAHLGFGLFANRLQVGEFIRLANMAPNRTRNAVESSQVQLKSGHRRKNHVRRKIRNGCRIRELVRNLLS